MASNPFDQFDAVASDNPFDQFDAPAAASAQPAKEPGLLDRTAQIAAAGNPLMTPVAEMAAHAVTASLATPVAGLAGIAGAILPGEKGQGVNWTEAIQNAFTYQPRSPGGQALQKLGGFLPGLITKGADASGQAAADVTGSPAVGAAVNTGVQMLPALLLRRLGGKAPERVSAGPAELPPAAAEKSSAQMAREAGFVLKPSEAGAKLGTIVEGLSGSAKVETAAIIKNSQRADQLAAQEIGVKELKGGEFAKAKEPHSAVYREVGTLGEVPAGPEYAADIGNIGRAPGNSFSKAVNSEVEQLKEQYVVERFDAKDAVQETRELRFKARKNMKSQDPAKNELGAAQIKVSDAIENQLERHAEAVGKSDLVARFRKARQELAKINTVIGAMRNGRISPELLAKQLDAGVPLSGNLRVIAQVAKDYPNVMRNASKVKGKSPVNMFETVIGLGGTAAGHPALAAALVARPITRAVLLSERYQSGFGKPKTGRALEAASPE